MKLTDREKLDLINSMEIIESSANGVEIEYILVKDNDENRKILNQIGLTEKDIESDCYPEDDMLDIVVVGFKFADFYDGKQKRFLVEDAKEVDLTKVPEIRAMLEEIAVIQEGWSCKCNETKCYWNMWDNTERYNSEDYKICVSESLAEFKMEPNSIKCPGYESR